MAQFQVPQFIDTEDKIIGPFTLKQFIYLAISGSISAFGFVIFEKLLAIVVAAILVGLAALLAFVKINGHEMSYIMNHAFRFFWNPKLYVFKRQTEDVRARALSQSHTAKSGLREIGEQLMTSRAAVPKREMALPPGVTQPKEKEVEERYQIVKEISGAREAARRIDYR